MRSPERRPLFLCPIINVSSDKEYADFGHILDTFWTYFGQGFCPLRFSIVKFDRSQPLSVSSCPLHPAGMNWKTRLLLEDIAFAVVLIVLGIALGKWVLVG